jgi:hypothetical protein
MLRLYCTETSQADMTTDDADDGAGSELPLVERFTLFFDFLGTSAAASWPKEKLYPFLDLLIAIGAQIPSAQSLEGSPLDDGGYRFQITPEVTAFSDNIVVSYPSPSDEESFPTDTPKHLRFSAHWTKFMCQDAIRMLSGVAEMALRIGVLIRGGYCHGQLYHENNVVFGEAMVDAHRLERDVAIYPRVLVSDRILEMLDGIPDSDRDFLLQDSDGCWHLNYFGAMLRHSSDGPIDDEQARRWKRAHLTTIEAEIAGSDGRIREKWLWFKRHFENATAAIPTNE